MKISVLLIDNRKKIMLTSENDHEHSALKMIAPGDKIEIITKWGNMFDKEEYLVGYKIEECRGGYYRAYPDQDSLMFIVTPKKKEKWK